MFVRIKDTTEHNMYVPGWEDRKLKTIISNAGTTLSGNPSKHKRHKKVEKDGMYETVIPTIMRSLDLLFFPAALVL